MKYIRTKNGKIYKALEDYMQSDLPPTKIRVENVAKDWHIIISKSQVIKQANAIEELCDGYIIESKNNSAIWFEMTCEEFNRQKPNFNNWVIYAYIKTDKGLIYKAKMKGVLPNGEIDWELL